MGFVKVVKNKSYYKRYQVRFRRRRQNLTNYRLRRNLIRQDKRKFNAPKWRLVVRFSNKNIVTQVAAAKISGDHILCSADSRELKRYGLPVGLTNYAAAYATGLLIARRLLKKLGLDEKYPGKKKLDGNRFQSRVSSVQWKPGDKIYRPFKCILDTGLARCTTGARVFAVMKGAVDGGLDIPHSVNRFAGFTKGKGEETKDEFKPDVLRAKIYGQHVADYMKKLQTENPDKFSKQFSQFIKEGVTADGLEETIRKTHAAIRKDPAKLAKVKKDWKSEKKSTKIPRMPKEEKEKRRSAAVAAKMSADNAAKAKAPADANGDITMAGTK